ncbi:acyl-CoA dehydrogenase family protein [Arthrobacter sp. Soil761]|uniref:acyl-CoA dehydrogenase family protein n=1 Tax=Arthrobacter sp. Soil761 TaxID=1736400 RepID=UPI000AE69693|nr:acyl-CoA dehydrogenase family protein [Arthrobacter sp. Soil761]
MLEYDVTEPLNTDYYSVFADIPETDRAAWCRARTFVEDSLPEMNDCWERAEFPAHLVKVMGEMNLLSDGVSVEGHQQLSALAAGLVNMEVSRGDGSLGTIIAVQGGLALRSIAFFGSEEQHHAWLGPMVRGEKLGAFALTEPEHGSDSVALETTARLDGSEYVLNGEKKWIGNGCGGDITVVWARDEAGNVRGFLVEQDRPGYEAAPITGKASLRAMNQALIRLNNVRVPITNVLPGTRTFKDVTKVLVATRLGVAWSALGHATAVYEAALNYVAHRTQFGKPLAKFQLIQDRLAYMLSELTSMQLHCVHLAALDTAGRMTPTQAAMAKYHNTRKARELASIARDMLGGNGILLENHVIRHLLDIESIHTYEGTQSIQALLIGRDVTGQSAFA